MSTPSNNRDTSKQDAKLRKDKKEREGKVKDKDDTLPSRTKLRGKVPLAKGGTKQGDDAAKEWWEVESDDDWEIPTTPVGPLAWPSLEPFRARYQEVLASRARIGNVDEFIRSGQALADAAIKQLEMARKLPVPQMDNVPRSTGTMGAAGKQEEKAKKLPLPQTDSVSKSAGTEDEDSVHVREKAPVPNGGRFGLDIIVEESEEDSTNDGSSA